MWKGDGWKDKEEMFHAEVNELRLGYDYFERDHIVNLLDFTTSFHSYKAVKQAMKSARPLWTLKRWYSGSPRVCAELSRYTRAGETSGKPAPTDLDARWQRRWQQSQPQSHAGSKPKSYILPMFAYPSGSLHMGHLRVYTISDVIARYKRMQGFDVLHPTGWDAFGLPAENAALERGIDPAVWTAHNIEKMKAQLVKMNTDFAWDKEFRTCDPSFYKHTQKIFLLLYERGLAYQAEAEVNYDPVDKTVLANEQVDSQGRSWRSGAFVQKVKLKQWFLKITQFREALLNDLTQLLENRKWPERVVTQQRNWLGKSNGARLTFSVRVVDCEETDISVYTTRPDTIFGVQYLALSMSHPLVTKLATQDSELQAFLDDQMTTSTNDKAGYALKGVLAQNPATGLIEGSEQSALQSLPVFVAPYVLSDYGEGAVMGVPAHDGRDLAFWKTHRPASEIPIVVSPIEEESMTLVQALELPNAHTGTGILTALCGKYAGLHSTEAAEKIVADLQSLEKAEAVENWRLRDWLISRQRYWGTPIPIVHCKSCGAVPVKDEALPVELPKLAESVKGTTGNPLDKLAEWVNVLCPSCSQPAKRDTDTMDTFVDSSWYFLRFPDAHNKLEPFSEKSAAMTLPVDTYVGGVEHAILHLLYARFIHKFLVSEGLISSDGQYSEPFSQLIAQGMVHGRTLSHPDTGHFLLPHEVSTDVDGATVIRESGQQPLVTWEKMSKSKHNGVDPTHVIDRWGADVVRAHILFAAPVGEVLQWDDEKIIGIERWFQRVTRLVEAAKVIPVSDLDNTVFFLEHPEMQPADIPSFLQMQSTINSVTKTFEQDLYSLNTAVSDLTKLTNFLVETKLENMSPWLAHKCISSLLQMLAPIAPAFAEQNWEDLQAAPRRNPLYQTPSIFEQQWPRLEITPELSTRLDALTASATATCVVHVNGKPRFSIAVSAKALKGEKEAVEDVLVKAAAATKEGEYWFTEKNQWATRKRIIVAKSGTMLNVVF